MTQENITLESITRYMYDILEEAIDSHRNKYDGSFDIDDVIHECRESIDGSSYCIYDSQTESVLKLFDGQTVLNIQKEYEIKNDNQIVFYLLEQLLFETIDDIGLHDIEQHDQVTTYVVKQLLEEIYKHHSCDVVCECGQCEDDCECNLLSITIACDDDLSWSFQTGDNSFTGSAYHYKHWGVDTIDISKDAENDFQSMAEYIVDQLDTQRHQCNGTDDFIVPIV